MTEKYKNLWYEGAQGEEYYAEDYHFYRDLDPRTNPGGDSVDKSLYHNKGNATGAT